MAKREKGKLLIQEKISESLDAMLKAKKVEFNGVARIFEAADIQAEF